MKLHAKTPHSIIYFLAGSLPFLGILHLEQLTLFAMICHLQDDPLNRHASYILSNPNKYKKSWFFAIRNICLKYELPHPQTLLENPLPRKKFKSLINTKINEFWHKYMSADIMSKSSLEHFNPHMMHTLTKPHQMWISAGNNPFEVSKTIVLARMVSGRYRTESVTRFWSGNAQGFCTAPTCKEIKGDLCHLLVYCRALQQTRETLFKMFLEKAAELPPLETVVKAVLLRPYDYLLSFILDPTSMQCLC